MAATDMLAELLPPVAPDTRCYPQAINIHMLPLALVATVAKSEIMAYTNGIYQN